MSIDDLAAQIATLAINAVVTDEDGETRTVTSVVAEMIHDWLATTEETTSSADETHQDNA